MAEPEDKTAEKSENDPEAKAAATSEAPSGATTAEKPEAKPDAKASEKTAEKTSEKSEDKVGGKRRAEPEKKQRGESDDKKATASSTVNTVRGYVATAVWVLAVLAAVILAVGALVITLDFNKDNSIVHFFVTTANKIDLGVFKQFKPGKGESPHSALVKTVLVSWGIAAIIYLVVGKILERIIRP